jgi:ubiquinone/menaquinone biosynthesis C-methylase UbiE
MIGQGVVDKYSQRAESYEELVEKTFDPVWEELLGKLKIKHGDHILDLGCGVGRTISRIISRHEQKKLHLFGVDCCPEMIAEAQKSNLPAAQKHGHQINFTAQDCLTFLNTVEAGKYHLIIASFILNYVECEKLFSAVNRALNPGGIFLILSTAYDHTKDFEAKFMKAVLNRHFFRIKWLSLLSNTTLVPVIGKLTDKLFASGFKKIEIEFQKVSFHFSDPMRCIDWIDKSGFGSQYVNLISEKQREKVLEDLVKYAEKQKISILGETFKWGKPFNFNWPFYIIQAEK